MKSTTQPARPAASMTPARPAASAAIFSSQNSAPSTAYLAHVRSRLLGDALLTPLRDALADLPSTWDALALARPDAAAQLRDARQRVQGFAAWLETGVSAPLEADAGGLVALPLLLAIQTVQYLDHLWQSARPHADYLRGVGAGGGIHGYCVGLLAAVVVASTADERELVARAAAGVRLAFAIGAFGDLTEAASSTWTTLALRLKQGSEQEERELLVKFPGVSET